MKPLSDDGLREIEARYAKRMLIGYLEVAIGDMSGGQETITLVTQDIPALCQTVRALREKHTQLVEVSGEWARLLDRIRVWSKCADGYPLDEHINNIATQNTALREQLAEAQSHLREQRETIKFWQRHIARMGKLLGTVAMDTEVEEAVKQLQSQLAALQAEKQK